MAAAAPCPAAAGHGRAAVAGCGCLQPSREDVRGSSTCVGATLTQFVGVDPQAGGAAPAAPSTGQLAGAPPHCTGQQVCEKPAKPTHPAMAAPAHQQPPPPPRPTLQALRREPIHRPPHPALGIQHIRVLPVQCEHQPDHTARHLPGVVLEAERGLEAAGGIRVGWGGGSDDFGGGADQQHHKALRGPLERQNCSRRSRRALGSCCTQALTLEARCAGLYQVWAQCRPIVGCRRHAACCKRALAAAAVPALLRPLGCLPPGSYCPRSPPAGARVIDEYQRILADALSLARV